MSAAAVVLLDVDRSAWRRVELWMTTLVNVASGQVLGVVNGRHSAAVEAWLGHATVNEIQSPNTSCGTQAGWAPPNA